MSTRRELADRFAMLQRGGTLPGDQGDEMLRRMVADRAPEAKETRRDMIMRHAAAPLSEAARAHIARVRSEPIDELPDYDIPVAQPPQSKAKAVNLEVNEELRQRRQPDKSRRERRKLTAPQPSAVTPTKAKRKHADNEFIVSILGDRSTTEACEMVGEAGRIAHNTGLDFTKQRYNETKKLGEPRFASDVEMYGHVMATEPLCRAAPSDAIQAVVNQLCRDIFNYVDRKNTPNAVPFPAFRKRHASSAYFVAARVVLDRAGNRVRLPLIGWVDVSSLADVPDKPIKRATITQHGSHWHIVLKLKS